MKINVWQNKRGKGVFIDQVERDFMNDWNSDPRHAPKVVKVKVFRTGDVTLPNDIRRQLPNDYFKPKIGDGLTREDFRPSNGKKRIKLW